MEQKSKSPAAALIIVAVVIGGGLMLLMCAGVLAAVAIPSFMRYQTRSKAIEAKVTTQQMASYAQMAFAENCAFPPPLPATSRGDGCCGGELCPTDATGPWAENVRALAAPTYFSYSAEADGNTLRIVATSDFVCGGPQHTVELMVAGKRDGTDCTAEVLPAAMVDEFQ